MTEKEEVQHAENKPKGKKKNSNAVKKKLQENTKQSAVTGIKKKKNLKVTKIAKKQKVSGDQKIENSDDENDSKPTSMTETPKANKHVVFDADENFDDLPDLVAVAPPERDYIDEENSDSDAPPEEETISSGRDIFAEEDKKIKNELIKLKNQVREARRLKHEKNREQQKKKKERLQKLEESRLPEDLLNAVAIEKDDEPQEIKIPKLKMRKRKLPVGILSDDDLVTLEKGVKVRSIDREVKKVTSVASIAAEFRQNALYNKQTHRMSSLDQRMMDVKQRKSGKISW